jgi:DedD protein
MSLFSFLRKNKQESATDDSKFYSRAEEDSKAVRSRKRRQGKQQEGNEPVDPVLPEKKRARRRLIGAIALVLAAVIGLPMVLDSEPKPVADDIAIQIPSKDKSAAAPVPRPEVPPMPATSKVAASASLDAKEEMLEPAEVPAAPVNAKPAPAKTEPVAAAKLKEEAKPKEEVKPAAAAVKPAVDKSSKVSPVAKADAHAGEKASEKASEKAEDAARARALLEGKPDPKAAEKKPGKFVIQVAALATKEKVNELQSKLKDAGIRSYTQKVATDSGDRTRIRVGPFANKEEAEKVRAKIVKLGLNGTLVPA